LSTGSRPEKKPAIAALIAFVKRPEILRVKRTRRASLLAGD
jgi:hypothetical protein